MDISIRIPNHQTYKTTMLVGLAWANATTGLYREAEAIQAKPHRLGFPGTAVGVSRIVELADNDRVVYDKNRSHVIKNVERRRSAEGGPYAACELEQLTDPKGCDWTATAQTPSIEMNFEECD